MKLLEYINLSDEEQTDLFYSHGEFIDTVHTFDAEYQLYSLWNFYVEITLCPSNSHIQRFSPFESGIRLEKYPKDLLAQKRPWID